MRLNARQWIQVVVSLAVAIWIFWFLYKDISFQSLKKALNEATFWWIGLSVLVSLLGYWIRAWRWKLLIEAGQEEYKLTTFRSFVAMMMGYVANLLVPRAGEVARCAALSKISNFQMGKLFGTVILERTIDFLFMIFTIALAFLLQRNLFLGLAKDLISVDDLIATIKGYWPLVLGAILVTTVFVYLVFQKYQDSGLFKKVRHFLRDIAQGFVSLKKVKNQKGFWISSVTIWVIYYLMMLFVAWAVPSTASLSLSAILLVMVMGSIGMVAPVQGGIGTFHALVAFILIAFGLSEEEGKIFAVIIHSSQVFAVIGAGILSLGFFFKFNSQKASKSY